MPFGFTPKIVELLQAIELWIFFREPADAAVKKLLAERYIVTLIV